MKSDEGIVKVTPALGRHILAEAEKSLLDIRKEKILETVRGLMWKKTEALKRVEEATKDAEWYDKQLRAIEAGDFSIDARDGTIEIQAGKR